MTGVNLSLEGRTALVTGASSGLGPHIARRLDAAGARACLHCHENRQAAGQLADELASSAGVFQADLGDAAAVQALFDAAASATGGLDILVNCAAAESQNVEDLAAT